jgi:hypothetical protein
MKFLMIALAVAAAVGGLAVGCGPQKAYCPDNSTGQCIDGGSNMPPPGDDAGLGGEAIVINDDA